MTGRRPPGAMSTIRRRDTAGRAGGGCCADCCVHASSSDSASLSPPPNRINPPVGSSAASWSDSSANCANGRLPAAWPATTPSARRHTTSNANTNAACHREIATKSGVGPGGGLSGAFSYDKSLAVEADTYFYFYAGSDKNALKKSGVVKKEPQFAPTPSRTHLAAISGRIAAGTGYRTYFEHFLSVRLCRSCQTRLKDQLWPPEPEPELRAAVKRSPVGEPRPKLSLDESKSSIRTNCTWLPSIIDFSASSSSNSSSSCVSPSGGSSSCSSPSTASLTSLAVPNVPLEPKKLEKRVICTLIDEFYSRQQEQRSTSVERQNLTPGRRAVFCPILTTNARGGASGRRAAAQHCCGCHNFACTTYPDKLAFVRAADDAAAAYTARIAQLMPDGDSDTVDESANGSSSDESNCRDELRLPLNASLNVTQATRVERECLRRYAHEPAFNRPGLSARLHVYSPHPQRDYCHAAACLFCAFKRDRAPEDEAAMRTLRACVADVRRALAAEAMTVVTSDIVGKCPVVRVAEGDITITDGKLSLAKMCSTVAGSDIITADNLKVAIDDLTVVDNGRPPTAECSLTSLVSGPTVTKSCPTVSKINLTVVSTDESAVIATDRESTVFDRRKSSAPPAGAKFCAATSVASALLSIPLAVIEEKISKLLKRFCNDPEEPNADERCNACCTRRASVRAYPCGHQVLCRMCSVTVIKKIFEAKDDVMRCVLCRRQVAVLRHHKSARHFAKRLIRPLYIAGERRSRHAVSPTPNETARRSPIATIASV